MTSLKVVILDRDGTIGEDGADQPDPDHGWKPFPGAMEAIARLNHGGWHVVIAANQGGLGRGVYEIAAINAQFSRMHKSLAAVGAKVDAVFFCPHAPDDGCRCRKPQPGLFEQIGERFGIDLNGTPAVGDAVEDLVAAAAAGCEPHLVLTGEGAQFRGRSLPLSFPANTRGHEDLAGFAQYLIERDAPVPAIAAN
jgi:D-glycero-D-manno-heptose 1,7-bisphosphate phosphatase